MSVADTPRAPGPDRAPGTGAAPAASATAPATADFTPSIYPLEPGAAAARLPGAHAAGGKGASLLRLAALGLPVPAGFVIGTSLCGHYHAHGATLPQALRAPLAGALERLETVTARRLGSHRRPLLVAVRSGAPASMPGMLETLLNVGLNEVTVGGLVRATGNPRLAWDCYRRFVRAYAVVVHGCGGERFDALVTAALAEHGLGAESELDTPTLRALTSASQALFRALTGAPFPQDPRTQLDAAIAAVLRSWGSAHARAYRAAHAIDETPGTAVTVQAMVFGNAGPTSGAGVGFTRDPATGARRLYVDFAQNAQGEDVVAGRHAGAGGATLARVLPAVDSAVAALAGTLEEAFHDMQDFEFTVQDGELYLLQTRAGKRTPLAALTIAVDLVDEGRLSPRDALARLAGLDVEAITQDRFADDDGAILARATPAGIGVASGRIAFDADQAAAWAAAGDPVVLVRQEATTSDFAAMQLAAGILTVLGAKTSHAAVVARELGRVCLVGCEGLEIDAPGQACTLAGRRLRAGDQLALDGNRGLVFAGPRAIVREAPAALIERVRGWRAAG
ncbi:MAG: PEP/pyruvate-binding domain-containing protein [Gammaproteobacteria bacterium]